MVDLPRLECSSSSFLALFSPTPAGVGAAVSTTSRKARDVHNGGSASLIRLASHMAFSHALFPTCTRGDDAADDDEDDSDDDDDDDDDDEGT